MRVKHSSMVGPFLPFLPSRIPEVEEQTHPTFCDAVHAYSWLLVQEYLAFETYIDDILINVTFLHN